LNRKINATIGNDDVASFAEGRYDGRDRRIALGVQNGSFSTKEIRNITLKVGMDI
jgi:hypothetical protein